MFLYASSDSDKWELMTLQTLQAFINVAYYSETFSTETDLGKRGLNLVVIEVPVIYSLFSM